MTLALSAMLAAFSFAELGLSGGNGGEALRVESDRCDFDRKRGVALFEGSVRVDYDPGYAMCADRLFVFFTGTNEVDRIAADGAVAVTNGNRTGSCESAVFLRKSGQIEMRGGETSLARLSETGANEVSGRRIRFWLDAGQVEVEGAEILVDKGGRSIREL